MLKKQNVLLCTVNTCVQQSVGMCWLEANCQSVAFEAAEWKCEGCEGCEGLPSFLLVFSGTLLWYQEQGFLVRTY